MNPAWLRWLSQLAPWLTLIMLIVMFTFLQGALAPVPSLAFDLPAAGAADTAQTGLVALLLPGDAEGQSEEGTLVFFDDARYALSDPTGAEEFATRLGERANETNCGTLVLLADRRVSAGDVMRVMAIAKSRRLAHVQLAEKRD